MAMYGQGAWSGSTSGSASQFAGAFSTTFTFAHAAISSGGGFGAITIASTTADVIPGDLIQVEITPTVNVSVDGFRTSTTATSRVTIVLSNPGNAATSTFSGTGRITWVKFST